MPASSAEARARWRKRKREHPPAYKSKLKEPENDEIFEDNEDDDDPNLDLPQNHLETKDDPQNNTGESPNQLFKEKEIEKLVDGGLRICEFPIAVKRLVSRPHSSVLGIVEAESSSRNGENRGQVQVEVAVLENISYGQLQALSVVPRYSPALLGGPIQENVRCSGPESYVIVPPRIVSGSGVIKRFGSAGKIHVVPVHSEWFSPTSVHRLERQAAPDFFSDKSSEHTPEKYIETRNFIVAKYMENPEKHLSMSDCHGLVAGIADDDLTQIVRFLDHWGIINYCAAPLKHEDGIYLCEDSNSELCVPSAALKSIESLIQFDKPKCRLKAEDVYAEGVSQCNKESDFDSTIREQLSENECDYCLRTIPTLYYQSQKEADVMLCLDCFNEGRFVSGHSSLDFSKVDTMNDCGDVDKDNWSDQETLLLLEGVQLYIGNWNKIAEHVGSKSKLQCILHFLSLPLDGPALENIDVNSTNLSNHYNNHERLESNSNGFGRDGDGSKSKFPFANTGNPVMNLVAFLASVLGPRVAAACAHASLSSLSKDGGNEGEISNSNKNGTWSRNDGKPVSLSPENVKDAALDGLAAAAMKAKLFADHEEREIQRLSANIVNHQLKRLELKLKQFAEVETLLMRECEQMEKTRQRIASERAHMMSFQCGSPATNTQGNRRQEDSGLHQPFVSGNGNNNQPVYLMQQQGIYGQRFPLSAIQQSSSASNSSFTPTSNSQSSLGHPILRPVTGTKSGFG